MNRQYTKAQVKAIDTINRKHALKESDVAGKKGFRRFHKVALADGRVVEKPGAAPDGYYEWSYKIPTRGANGKPTKAIQEMGERLKPWQQADTERYAHIQRNMDRVTMKDNNGNVRYVDPAQAGSQARDAGWSHAFRAAGVLVKSGIDGRMDYRMIRDEWEPTGYKLVRGERISVSGRGLYYDPDGTAWKRFKGQWLRIL